MLRITMTNSPEEQRWSLQGQLVGQWAAELRSAWREARVVGDTRRCIVELIEVTSIDHNGEEALSEIMRRRRWQPIMKSRETDWALSRSIIHYWLLRLLAFPDLRRPR